MLSGIRLVLAALLLAAAATAVPAQAAGKEKQATGLPVPRFVTLRSGEVNVRTGPGVRYPVEWVFTRKEMPVEITAEFDTWRRIRDWEGSEGWVHQSMLSGKRGVVVLGAQRVVRREPQPESPTVARAQPGVMGWLSKCKGEWCQVDLKGYKGWLKRAEVWGVYPDERFE
jgi:SH3-like domain-containing protein